MMVASVGTAGHESPILGGQLPDQVQENIVPQTNYLFFHCFAYEADQAQ